MDKKNFGAKLRKLREQHGLSLRQLAEQIEYSHAFIYKVESGLRNPSLNMVMKISKIFDVSLDVLMDEDQEILAD